MGIRNEDRLERRRRQMKRRQKKAAEGKQNEHEKDRIDLLRGTYRDQDVFVVGTGPSLTGFDFTRLNGLCTIALNDAVKIPGYKPTFAMFADTGIWTRYRDMALPEGTRMVCKKRARENFLRYKACSFRDRILHYNQVSDISGLREEDDGLFIQRTVATGGICLAWKMGAKRVFLLGVDGYKFEDRYYHDGSVKRVEKRKERKLDQEGRIIQDRHDWWIKNMDELRAFFDKRKIYQETYVLREKETGVRRYGSGIFLLSGHSPIEAWQKVKLKTIFKPR